MKRPFISKRLRFEVFSRDNFTCQYCGRQAPSVKLHADHIVPVSRGGPTNKGNLRTSCEDCNNGKGASRPDCGQLGSVTDEAYHRDRDDNDHFFTADPTIGVVICE